MVTKKEEENENYYNFRNGQGWAEHLISQDEEKEEVNFLELTDFTQQKIIPKEKEKNHLEESNTKKKSVL